MALQDLYNIVFLMILKILIMITSFLKINKWNRLFNVFSRKNLICQRHLGQMSRFYYERSRYIMKGQGFIMNDEDVLWKVLDFIINGGLIYIMADRYFVMNGLDFHNDRSRFYHERSRFSWSQIEVFMATGQDFMMNGWHFHDDRSRFSLWQVEIIMMTGRGFHGDRSKFYYEW